jgi:two-component system chemotaxis response regulator CheY
MKLKTVLVIDDSTFMRMIIKKILGHNGFRVIGEAENGKIGVNLYLKLQPTLVTMDINMPVMDGVQALKEILQLDPTASIVMVSTMCGQKVLVNEVIIAGAKSVVSKPFTSETIVNALNSLLKI